MIASLVDNNGIPNSTHAEKVEIPWVAYKERLGLTEFQRMVSDLSQWLTDNPDLTSLEDPFTHEEIDSVVASLPSDKSLGPDGFNTNFIKRHWPIIKARLL